MQNIHTDVCASEDREQLRALIVDASIVTLQQLMVGVTG